MKQTKLYSRIAVLSLFAANSFSLRADAPFFPTGLTVASSGELLITHKGKKSVDMYAPADFRLVRSVSLSDEPTGVATGKDYYYVTTFGQTGNLQIVSSATGRVEATVPTGSGATAPLLSPDGRYVYVCNRFSGTVSEVDVKSRKVNRTVRVLREPVRALFSADGRYLFVANFLPDGRADVETVTARISVVDARSFRVVRNISLANGSNALRGICLTPDGRYLLVVHNLGRFTVPTSQLQQGWMNTSAFSLIDVASQSYLGTVVVDEPERGAAGVWDIACDDNHLYVNHSGTHEVSVIDYPALIRRFEQYEDKTRLDFDLNFLYGIRKRIPLRGNGPRNFVLKDGKLYIPTYFSDILNVLDTRTLTLECAELNPSRHETDENKGERYFNDASRCFQNWQSCNGCHPGDGRTDGMNWDLMNDGVGNPKNCKSLLFSHVTPPNMISGIRQDAEHAVRAGFRFIQFFNIAEDEAVCVDAYLKSLRPVPSPYLVDGKLSPLAEEGKKVFEKEKCDECHSGPYYTNLKTYRIGTDIEFEKGWDTPTLCEVWRTAPYLFDGRAKTMEEVFEVYKHGVHSKLSKKEIKALTEYVNSL